MLNGKVVAMQAGLHEMLLQLADISSLPCVRQCAVRLLGMLPTCPATVASLQVSCCAGTC